MTKRQIERFLTVLARELEIPARAYLTGAAAAALWGRVRPSVDVDLGIELLGRRTDAVRRHLRPHPSPQPLSQRERG